MALTESQSIVLRDLILADGGLSAQPANSDGAFAIAEALNTEAVPAFTVWRTLITTDEIMNGGFVWTEVDTLTAGKARIWEWMIKQGSINPSKPNIRQGLADCFGSGSAMAAAVLPLFKRNATIAEKLLATGTGSDNSPGTMSFEGSLTYQDIQQARAS